MLAEQEISPLYCVTLFLSVSADLLNWTCALVFRNRQYSWSSIALSASGFSHGVLLSCMYSIFTFHAYWHTTSNCCLARKWHKMGKRLILTLFSLVKYVFQREVKAFLLLSPVNCHLSPGLLPGKFENTSHSIPGCLSRGLANYPQHKRDVFSQENSTLTLFIWIWAVFQWNPTLLLHECVYWHHCPSALHEQLHFFLILFSCAFFPLHMCQTNLNNWYY